VASFVPNRHKLTDAHQSEECPSVKSRTRVFTLGLTTTADIVDDVDFVTVQGAFKKFID